MKTGRVELRPALDAELAVVPHQAILLRGNITPGPPHRRDEDDGGRPDDGREGDMDDHLARAEDAVRYWISPTTI